MCSGAGREKASRALELVGLERDSPGAIGAALKSSVYHNLEVLKLTVTFGKGIQGVMKAMEVRALPALRSLHIPTPDETIGVRGLLARALVSSLRLPSLARAPLNLPLRPQTLQE